MLSQKAKYAIKALLVLARAQDKNLLAQARDISTTENIPKKFLDLIFFELRRHGLVQSTRGREGGYSLAKPAAEISIADARLLAFGIESETRVVAPCPVSKR
jgi:Rrf2 family protein